MKGRNHSSSLLLLIINIIKKGKNVNKSLLFYVVLKCW